MLLDDMSLSEWKPPVWCAWWIQIPQCKQLT